MSAQKSKGFKARLLNEPQEIDLGKSIKYFKFEGEVVSMGGHNVLVANFALIKKEKVKKDLNDLPYTHLRRIIQEHGREITPKNDTIIARKAGHRFHAYAPADEVDLENYLVIAALNPITIIRAD